MSFCRADTTNVNNFYYFLSATIQIILYCICIFIFFRLPCYHSLNIGLLLCSLAMSKSPRPGSLLRREVSLAHNSGNGKYKSTGPASVQHLVREPLMHYNRELKLVIFLLFWQIPNGINVKLTVQRIASVVARKVCSVSSSHPWLQGLEQREGCRAGSTEVTSCFSFYSKTLAHKMVPPTFRAARKALTKVRSEPRLRNHWSLHYAQHLEPVEASSTAPPLQLSCLQHV